MPICLAHRSISLMLFSDAVRSATNLPWKKIKINSPSLGHGQIRRQYSGKMWETTVRNIPDVPWINLRRLRHQVFNNKVKPAWKTLKVTFLILTTYARDQTAFVPVRHIAKSRFITVSVKYLIWKLIIHFKQFNILI